MPGELDALPGGQIGEDLLPHLGNLLLPLADFVLKIDTERMRFRMLLEFLELVLQFDNRFLEIELMFHARSG